MGEAVFKTTIVLLLGAVAFIAFKFGSFWGSSGKGDELVGIESVSQIFNRTKSATLEIKNVEHNIPFDAEHPDVFGIKAFLHVEINGYKGKNCILEVRFYDGEGNPLLDNNGDLSIDGQVGATTSFVVDENSFSGDIDFCFPYQEMHVSQKGRNYVILSTRLLIKNTVIAESNPFLFYVNNN